MAACCIIHPSAEEIGCSICRTNIAFLVEGIKDVVNDSPFGELELQACRKGLKCLPREVYFVPFWQRCIERAIFENGHDGEVVAMRPSPPRPFRRRPTHYQPAFPVSVEIGQLEVEPKLGGLIFFTDIPSFSFQTLSSFRCRLESASTPHKLEAAILRLNISRQTELSQPLAR